MGVRQTIVTAAVFVLSSPLLVSQARAPYTVTAVHHSSGSGLTRVAIEVSAKADFHGVRLHNPERFYIDILNSYPNLGGRASQSEELQDPTVNRIRVATFDAVTTRVVLDLVSPAVLTSVTRLANPDRIVIEARAAAGHTIPAVDPPARPTPLVVPPLEEPSIPASPAGAARGSKIQPVAFRISRQSPTNDAVDVPPATPAAAPAPAPEVAAPATAAEASVADTGTSGSAAAPPFTADPPAANKASRSHGVEEGLFELDVFGKVDFYRSTPSGIGTKFTNAGGGGARLVENLYSHFGLEESFSYSANNLKILNPVTIGVPTEFGMGQYSFALNPVFYVTGLNRPVRPYLTAGVGVAYFHPTDDAVRLAQSTPNAFGSPATFSSEAKLQFNYGGGVRWKVTRHVGFFIEGRGLLSKNPSLGLACINCCNWLWGLEVLGGVTFHWGARQAFIPPAVVVIPPAHRFTPGKIHGAASVCAGSPVVLSSDASDAGGSTLTYHWTIDGQPGGDTRQLTFTPDHPGEYQIQLAVADSNLIASAPPPSELAFSVRALDCAPKTLPCCSLDVACSSVIGELAIGGTAPLHVTAIGAAADKVHYNWSASEGRIVNPNSADATFDATGVSFPASYQTQTKIITVTASVTDDLANTKSCQTQITIKKEPEPVHYDVVFAQGRSRVNNCAKRFLIDRLYPDLGRSYRGYTVYLVGHRDANETGPLDRDRALNVAAVLAAGKGACGKLDRLRIKTGWLGVQETPYVETPCALSTESIAERKADQIDYSDPQVKERRVEIWLVPEGQTLPLSVPNAQVVRIEDLDRLGCPK